MTHGRYDRDRVSATNPKILRVAKAMSKRLSDRGVKHALIGGLAVGAYGYDRATQDADFLIETAHAEDIAGSALGGEVEGKTIKVQGVFIDFLFPREHEEFLTDAIAVASVKRGMPTIAMETLIYMKLTAARARDQGDIVELVKRGKVDVKKVIAYLKRHRSTLVDEFLSRVLQAKAEAD